ncbi:MAG: DUF3891 family protein [Phycisphaeraceae bacterium]
MIVVEERDNTLRIVTQPDHAGLAATLAEHWCRPATLPQGVWPRVLEAVRRHDDGWEEAELEPAVDQRGRPHTFKSLPTAAHADIWRRGVNRLAADDPYAGLLVALHGRWLYTSLARASRRDDPAALTLLADLTERVDALLARARKQDESVAPALSPHALETARRIVGLLDAWSLMLVGGLAPSRFPEPVSFGSATVRMDIEPGQAAVRITPWPFDRDGPLDVAVPARWIPARRYRNGLDVMTTLRKADARELRYRLIPP